MPQSGMLLWMFFVCTTVLKPYSICRIHGYPIICPRIEHISFNFDPIGILNLCQQTELLFSMFVEAKEKRLLLDPNVDKANRLLLDNFLEHLGIIHDRELELSKEESDRFTQEILLRHRNKHPHVCPITEILSYKGIVSHVCSLR